MLEALSATAGDGSTGLHSAAEGTMLSDPEARHVDPHHAWASPRGQRGLLKTSSAGRGQGSAPQPAPSLQDIPLAFVLESISLWSFISKTDSAVGFHYPRDCWKTLIPEADLHFQNISKKISRKTTSRRDGTPQNGEGAVLGAQRTPALLVTWSQTGAGLWPDPQPPLPWSFSLAASWGGPGLV